MDRKNSLYTIVFYTSLLITCVLIAAMLLAPLTQHEPKTVKENPRINVSVPKEIPSVSTTAAVAVKRVEFTEEELKTILSAVLKETIGFEIDTLMLTYDSVTIMSKANKEAICARIAESNEKIGNALNVALKVAPETIDVDTDIRLITNAKTHNIELSVTKLSVLGFHIPISLIPEEICDSISDFINTKREELGLRDLSVSVENGKLILSGL